MKKLKKQSSARIQIHSHQFDEVTLLKIVIDGDFQQSGQVKF